MVQSRIALTQSSVLSQNDN